MDEQTMWQAMTVRDRAHDGTFWYGVVTTGVYCRPSCAGRPLRRNVRFFATPVAAREAGLRACRRCRPDAVVAATAWQYDFARTQLGLALIVADAIGIRLLILGDSERSLLAEARERLQATLVPAAATDERFLAWARALASCVAGGELATGRAVDLSLQEIGTPFQRAVWSALQRVACGRVASYQEIAHAIGKPRAVRAVAQACAANPVAVFVPCHRIVRSDGALGGYRWGMARKRALLDAERAGRAGVASC